MPLCLSGGPAPPVQPSDWRAGPDSLDPAIPDLCVCACALALCDQVLAGAGDRRPRAQGYRQDSGRSPSRHSTCLRQLGRAGRSATPSVFVFFTVLGEPNRWSKAAATSRPSVLVPGERVEFGRARDEEDKVCALRGGNTGDFSSLHDWVWDDSPWRISRIASRPAW